MIEVCAFHDITFEVKLSRLVELENKERELKKAKRLIEVLRIKNKILKEERHQQHKIYAKTFDETKDRAKRSATVLLGLRLGLDKKIGRESEVDGE